jgi:hypothetical protein
MVDFFSAADSMASSLTDMSNQTLPPEAVNSEPDETHWTKPDHWSEGPASSMRKATYRSNSVGGEIEVAVTSFPGDVGGLLANVNRWRSQIGLDSTNADQLGSFVRASDGEPPITWVQLENPTSGEAILAAIQKYAGNSWFFKMSGPITAVETETEAMETFVASVHYH